MRSATRVSTITAVRNGQAYIAEAIESVSHRRRLFSTSSWMTARRMVRRMLSPAMGTVLSTCGKTREASAQRSTQDCLVRKRN